MIKNITELIIMSIKKEGDIDTTNKEEVIYYSLWWLRYHSFSDKLPLIDRAVGAIVYKKLQEQKENNL